MTANLQQMTFYGSMPSFYARITYTGIEHDANVLILLRIHVGMALAYHHGIKITREHASRRTRD